VDVKIAPTSIQFVKTFVTKMTQKHFKIANRTSAPVRFSLKRFETPAEEERMIQAEVAGLLSRGASPDKSAGLLTLEEGPDEQEAARKRFAKRLLTQTCLQKYLFESSVVRALPLEGVVYPDTSIEVCWLAPIRKVLFVGKQARSNSAVLYLLFVIFLYPVPLI
jgi:hypothetical protein